MILVNAAKCLKCDTVIQSFTRHDFRTCTCGNVFVDGGTDYIRHGYMDVNFYEDLSAEDERPNAPGKVGW